jgi:Zn-dependent protease/CBS domain-containing protein
MGWSFPIGSVKGTVVRVHLTFLLFLAFIGFASYVRGGGAAAADSIVYILALFLCVLLHEFGHVFAARRYGVQTPDVTLLPIGGVARLERIPEKPGQELIVALAGPAVNVVIALLLFILLGGAAGVVMELTNPRVGLLERLLTANIFLVLFNMIPAFPMDGGRVLRALLAYRLGFGRATQIAATIGQGLAFALGLFGLFTGNALLVFIALFVYLGAAGEAAAVQTREAGRGLIAADAMITQFEPLQPGDTIADAADALIRTTQHEFPVLDAGGRLQGLITRDCIIKALRKEGPQVPVARVMRTDIPTVSCRQGLETVTEVLGRERLPAVGVIGNEAHFMGYITPENLSELVMTSRARPARRSALNPWTMGPVRT